MSTVYSLGTPRMWRSVDTGVVDPSHDGYSSDPTTEVILLVLVLI